MTLEQLQDRERELCKFLDELNALQGQYINRKMDIPLLLQSSITRTTRKLNDTTEAIVRIFLARAKFNYEQSRKRCEELLRQVLASNYKLSKLLPFFDMQGLILGEQDILNAIDGGKLLELLQAQTALMREASEFASRKK